MFTMKAEGNGFSVPPSRQLHVDILRGRNYPQTEDDPCACSTFLRVFFYDASLTKTIAKTFTTQLQEDSNAPFYNAGVDIDLPTELDSIRVVIEVVETTRRTLPYVMFYGSFVASLSKKGKHEETIVLTHANPVDDLEKATHEAVSAAGNLMAHPVLGIRYNVSRLKTEETVKDPHADVVLPSNPQLTGSCTLVPKDAQYVWINLLSDARWNEAFRYALVHEWRHRPSLLDDPTLTPKGDPAVDFSDPSSLRHVALPKHLASRKHSTQPTPVMDVRTIGDVILKKWCCRRSHEVLTRLLLCAEAFNRKEGSLNFTREHEVSFRLRRKERVHLLKEITRSSLMKMTKAELRDVIDSLWIFFATGIKNDPSGLRVLANETRKKVREACFDEEDKMILQSSLLNFIVPSLSLDDCNAILVADFNNAEAASSDEMKDGSADQKIFGKNNPMAPPASEVEFAMALVDYIGPLLDTLTEAEMVTALRVFEPAIVNAQQRIKNGAKEEIKRTRGRFREPRQPVQRKGYTLGTGIKIAHLDILGRRKDVNGKT